MRNTVKREMTFKDLLLHVRTTLMEAEKNTNYYSYNEIIKLPNLPDRADNFHLFDTLILFKSIHDEPRIKDQKSAVIFSFDMTGEYMEGEINYNRALFNEAFIDCLVKHLINFFKALTLNSGARLSEIEILSDEEKRQLLVKFNDSRAGFPGDKTIQRLFAEQAAKTPDAAAIVFKDALLTYSELNKKILFWNWDVDTVEP